MGAYGQKLAELELFENYVYAPKQAHPVNHVMIICTIISISFSNFSFSNKETYLKLKLTYRHPRKRP